MKISCLAPDIFMLVDEYPQHNIYAFGRINLIPAHKGMSTTAPQMVSALVAKRSKRPAYPANTLWVFWARTKKGIKTIGRRPQTTENDVQPRKFGFLQKRRAMTNKPRHMACTTRIVKVR